MNPNSSTENVDHKEDRLSNLPDHILTGILSHLVMKELVSSGILSKRWKSVWLSVPTLVFLQWDFRLRGQGSNDDETKSRFSNFVNKMLIARKLPSLEKLTIFAIDLDHHHLKLWVQAALERHASELKIDFLDLYTNEHDDDRHLPCELTPNLFTFNKLVVLKLRGYMAPNFPTTSSCFHSLKELTLKDIYYRDYDSLPNLLSSCPVLECLTILREEEWHRSFGNTGTLIITSRSLKRLIVDCEVDSLFLGNDDFKTVIDAPAVEFLDISCIMVEEYVVKNLSSLVKARLGYLNWFSVLEFLKSTPQLEILILEIIIESELSELDVPSCLITHVKTIDIIFESWDYIEKVRYFLTNAKVLERMTIRFIVQDESLKMELYNVLLESAADSVTWSDKGISEAVVSFSKPRI